MSLTGPWHCIALCLAALTAGCIPIRTTRVAHEVTLATSTREDDTDGDPRRTIDITASDERSLTLRVQQSETCRRVHLQRYEAHTTVTHEVNPFVHVGAYVAAASLLGAGIGVFVDAPNVAVGSDPHVRNPVGRDGAIGVGVGLEALGVAALIYGAFASAEDADDEDVDPARERETGSEEIECRSGAASSEPVYATIRSGAEAVVRLPVGLTDTDGSLTVDLIAAFPTQLAEGRDVTFDAGDATVTTPVRPFLRIAEAERWDAGLPTIDQVRAFIAAFPHGAHRADATRALAALRVPELRSEIGAALDARDLASVDTLIAELRELAPGDPAVADADMRRAALHDALEDAAVTHFAGGVAGFRIHATPAQVRARCRALGGALDDSGFASGRPSLGCRAPAGASLPDGIDSVWVRFCAHAVCALVFDLSPRRRTERDQLYVSYSAWVGEPVEQIDRRSADGSVFHLRRWLVPGRLMVSARSIGELLTTVTYSVDPVSFAAPVTGPTAGSTGRAREAQCRAACVAGNESESGPDTLIRIPQMMQWLDAAFEATRGCRASHDMCEAAFIDACVVRCTRAR
jgi:hypothetical protein